MADILTKAERSLRMKLVKGHGNRSTEGRLESMFRFLGITGWRRRQRLPGRPDFVFRRSRIALFVDGCFWHSCPRHYTTPVVNAAFWRRKRHDNVARDRRVDAELRQLGWRVIRIWEHELRPRNETTLGRRLKRLFPDTRQ
jgi:DNA mismatch endonuclease, patch repair protein